MSMGLGTVRRCSEQIAKHKERSDKQNVSLRSNKSRNDQGNRLVFATLEYYIQQLE
jgi:hypothetical protein